MYVLQKNLHVPKLFLVGGKFFHLLRNFPTVPKLLNRQKFVRETTILSETHIWGQMCQNPGFGQIPDLGTFDIIISLPSHKTGVKCLYRYRKKPHLGGFNQPLIRRGGPP